MGLAQYDVLLSVRVWQFSCRTISRCVFKSLATQSPAGRRHLQQMPVKPEKADPDTEALHSLDLAAILTFIGKTDAKSRP